MQPRDGMRGVARPKIARRRRGVHETEEDESEEENGRTWRVPGDEGKRGRNNRRVD